MSPLRTAILLTAIAIVRLAPAQTPDRKIRAEIHRLQDLWQRNPATGLDMPIVIANAKSSLKGAEEALDSGRVFLALERLLQGAELYHGIHAISEKSAAMTGMPAFEAEWSKASVDLAGVTRQVAAAKWNRSPAAVRALSETALGRSVPLLDGARGFATATGPKDGLLYLGQANGEAEFARFCTTLDLTAKRRTLPARSLLPELLALQAKADAAFQPPRSIEQHPRFIALNSTIKLARELDSGKSYYGALYQYLEAVRHHAFLDAAQPDAARQEQLRSLIESERRKTAAADRDDSILQLFLERAASQSAHADGSAPTADEWRSAEAIMTQVLPAYAAALRPAAPLRHISTKTIDLTLVRWPYT